MADNTLVSIPEKIQKGLRARLKLARLQCGKNRSGIDSTFTQTIYKYEEVDISSMKLRTIYALAKEYGWTLPQMMTYLTGPVDEDELLALRSENRDVRLMNVYMRSLSTEAQRLAVEQVGLIVDYNAAQGGVTRKALNSNSTLRLKESSDSEFPPVHLSASDPISNRPE